MSIQQDLLGRGIGFKKGNSFLPFPVDDKYPILSGDTYGVTQKNLANLNLAWKQWKKFAAYILSSKKGMNFFVNFLMKGYENRWGDFERSEVELYQREAKYFFGSHVTRVDYVVSDGILKILDPNVMPYGISPMVAVQEILGISSQKDYLKKLAEAKGTWVCDRSHGGASSVKWLCKKAGILFSFADEFNEDVHIIKQTRHAIAGSSSTINAPGIRIFESQLWSALINIPGLAKSFGFNVDTTLHRNNCAPCYIVKVENGKIMVAYSYENNEMQWLSFECFNSLFQWAQNTKNVFLKSIFTSGCHQVTFSKFKNAQIVKAISRKLDKSFFYLLQPAFPCMINNNRVRVASFIGPSGEHYGSEVTKVHPSAMLVHGGEHAKVSYLEI